MKQVRVLISGFVQGVGFRHFMRSKARNLGLTGWVKNLPASPSASQGGPDGSVEAVLQGSKENIEKLITFCKKGPFLSEVENVEVKWENSSERLQSFEII